MGGGAAYYTCTQVQYITPSFQSTFLNATARCKTAYIVCYASCTSVQCTLNIKNTFIINNSISMYQNINPLRCTCMYYSLHQASWPLGNQLTCPVGNVYSANFSVRSITYLEKKIGLIIINKIITFAVVLVLICKRYYFSEL